jgi:voltage-gated potassium channel
MVRARQRRRLGDVLDALRARSATERDRLAELIACRADRVYTVLGILFLLVVLGQTLAEPASTTARFLLLAGWVLWSAFVLEFVARLIVAPSALGYLRRNWWQLGFLVVPFLRFIRVLAIVRAGRAGSVLSSAVRSSRTSRGLLAGRLSWLGLVTGIVVLASSQLLYAFATEPVTYARSLHAATYGVLTGQPARIEGAVPALLELVLAAYSVLVFATLAATLGAYFIAHPADDQPRGVVDAAR